MKTLFFCILILTVNTVFSQTIGPNPAGNGSNSTASGSVAWSNPNNIIADDGVRATCTNGLTQILRASQFGFSIPPSANILGIEMWVEKRGRSISNVSAGTWQFRQAPNFVSGQAASTYNTTSYSYTLGAGANRLLLVIIAIENVDNTGSNPGITLNSVIYGGQTLTALAIQSTASTTTRNLIAAFYLREAQLASVVGTTLTVNKTRSATAPGDDDEYVEYLSINTFSEVNQLFPIEFVTASNSGTGISAGPLNIRRGDYLVGALNSNTPGIAYTQSAGNTLVSNVSVNNVVSAGITYNLQTRSGIATTGTATPGVTSGTSTGRLNMINMVITGGRAFDNLTRLHQGGTPLGSNLSLGNAAVSQAWPDEDQLTLYGNNSELWGRTWTAAEVNDPGFGIDIQADATGADVGVDFVRASVTFTIPLPVASMELLCTQTGISGTLQDGSLTEGKLQILRSKDGFEFESVLLKDIDSNFNHVVFSDNKTGSWYYKLMLHSNSGIDQIGNVSFCSDRSTQNSGIFPNPASSEFTVYSNDKKLEKLKIKSIDGRISKMLNLQNEEFFSVDIFRENLLPGAYLVTLYKENSVEHHKLIIH